MKSWFELDLEAGDHLCAFFWGVKGRDAVMLPFLEAGLEAGDKCLCLVHATTPSDVLGRLGEPDRINALVASHRLNVMSATDTHVPNGRFSIDGMVNFYEHYVTDATADGSMVRVTGEGSWALDGYPGSEQLIDYESSLNDMAMRDRRVILCLYDLALFGGGMVMDLLKTHPKILLGGLPVENPNYLTPEEYRAARPPRG
jgi:hypothetical protein